jgi:hypothetical protein
MISLRYVTPTTGTVTEMDMLLLLQIVHEINEVQLTGMRCSCHIGDASASRGRRLS